MHRRGIQLVKSPAPIIPKLTFGGPNLILSNLRKIGQLHKNQN